MSLTEKDIERAKGKEPAAFEKIYNETIKSAYYVARKFLKNDAEVEDVLQESYIKVYEKIDSYQSGNFQGWVDTIVANGCKDYLKKKNPLLFSDLATDDNDNSVVNNIEETNEEFRPDLKMDYEETKRLVLEIIEKLPDDQKISVILFYYEQLGVKEIANSMDCSVNTIKSRLNYARKSIKSEVEKLEKKGTKLYCAPIFSFLLWLFKEDVKACTVPASFASGNVAAKSIQKNLAQNLAKNVARQTVKKAGLSLTTKVIIGVAATVLVGGVTTVAIDNHNNNKAALEQAQDKADDSNIDKQEDTNQEQDITIDYVGEYYIPGTTEDSMYANGGKTITINEYDGSMTSFRIDVNSPKAAHIDEIVIDSAEVIAGKAEFTFPSTSFGTYGHGSIEFKSEESLLVNIVIDGNSSNLSWSMSGEENQVYTKNGKDAPASMETDSKTDEEAIDKNVEVHPVSNQTDIDKIVENFLNNYEREESFTTGGYTLHYVPEIGTYYVYFMCGDIPFISTWMKYEETNNGIEPFYMIKYYYVDKSIGRVEEFKDKAELYALERPTFYKGAGEAFIAHYEDGILGNNFMIKVNDTELTSSEMSDADANVALNGAWAPQEWKKLGE